MAGRQEPFEFAIEVPKGEVPYVSIRLFQSKKSDESKPLSMHTPAKPDDDVEFLQVLEIKHLPRTEAPRTGWLAFSQPKTERVDFSVVAELKGMHVTFRLKCGERESPPTEPLLSDWREYKAPYNPPCIA